MSHFTVLVIGDDVDSAMEPYQENNFGTTKDEYLEYEEIDLADHGYKTHQEAIDDGFHNKDGKATSVCNPNSFFDYYSEGGRWKGMILTKDGELVDRARKGNIDFDTMYTEAIEKAIERYDMAMAIFGELPPHKSLEELSQELKESDALYPTKKAKITARKIWIAQPRVIAMDTALESGLISLYKLFPDDYTKTKKEYIEEYKMKRFSTYGIVIAEEDDEGEYLSRDWMSDDEYNKVFKQQINNADDDDWLTILDCHV